MLSQHGYIKANAKEALSQRLEGSASRKMANIRVCWEGNGSPRYDGKTQDVAVKWVVKEDRDDMAVGKTVRVKWGRGGRIWMAIVVDFLRSTTEDDDGGHAKTTTSLHGKLAGSSVDFYKHNSHTSNGR